MGIEVLVRAFVAEKENFLDQWTGQLLHVADFKN